MQKTILVIEDDPDIRNVVTYTLEDAGYQTLTAETAMNGLITAREAHPDLTCSTWACRISTGARSPSACATTTTTRP